MPNTVVQSFLVLAVCLLFGSAWTIFRFCRILQHSRYRLAWTCVCITLVPAALGCLLFLYLNVTEGNNHHEDWLVACLTLIAAAITSAMSVLSFLTAKDLARIDDLERAAFFDPLTNLYSRGHIDSLLRVECQRSRAETRPLSVMMMDIDNFKVINDRFGHRGGDFVLKEVAKLLRQAVGSPYLVGRYGGEEFVVVLTNTSPFLAEQIAERIRATVCAARLEYKDSTLSVSVSIGVKTTLTFREEAKELVADADLAMYEAKRQGKNRIVSVAERRFEMN